MDLFRLIRAFENRYLEIKLVRNRGKVEGSAVPIPVPMDVFLDGKAGKPEL